MIALKSSVKCYNKMIAILFLIFIFINRNYSILYEGDDCFISYPQQQNGKCLLLENCQYAVNILKNQQSYRNIYNLIQHCGFNKSTPIVCCPTNQKITNSTTTTIQPITTSVQPTIRSKFHQTPGTISKKKCEEMLLKIKLGSHPIIGGEKALSREFPHMAILGFGNDSHIEWLCGGSLISENYVITAAHCTFYEQFGYVKYVRLGDLDINDPTDDAEPQNFTIVNMTSHPLYKPPGKYNDIALLQLDRDVTFTAHVQPACLYDVKNLPKCQILTATGWGLTEFGGEPSNHLMKVDLKEYQLNICKERYKTGSNRTLPNGILDEIQVCAGNRHKDTCQGDSGGPLQFKTINDDLGEYTKIVGITSLGKGCGSGNIPGLYTRISYYLEWIESVVWPI